jgi:CheY-like chemotaxis protein
MARVLVVEDDPDSRKLICHRLRRAGHVPEATATGEGALRLLSKGACELIMLDVNLPGISGWEVARRVASDPKVARLILFVSIVDRDETPQDIVVEGWLDKPFTSSGLNHAVEEILHGTG